MRFAIVIGLGLVATAIRPFDFGQDISWLGAIIFCFILDMAEYGKKYPKKD